MNNVNISEYIKEAEEIERLYLDLLENTRNRYDICEIKDHTKELQRRILRRYEIWYEVCKRIIKEYSDNFELFTRIYSDIKDNIFLNIDSNECDISALKEEFIHRFDIQVNILHTIEPIISLEENSYKKLVTSDLLDSELDQAELLYDKEFIRAAGVIAGVVLERHLKTLCEINKIHLGSKDTMNPIAQKLYKSEEIPEFDIND